MLYCISMSPPSSHTLFFCNDPQMEVPMPFSRHPSPAIMHPSSNWSRHPTHWPSLGSPVEKAHPTVPSLSLAYHSDLISSRLVSSSANERTTPIRIPCSSGTIKHRSCISTIHPSWAMLVRSSHRSGTLRVKIRVKRGRRRVLSTVWRVHSIAIESFRR